MTVTTIRSISVLVLDRCRYQPSRLKTQDLGMSSHNINNDDDHHDNILNAIDIDILKTQTRAQISFKKNIYINRTKINPSD